jgi:WD40 repeat protein
VRQSSVWVHDGRGDRQISLEGRAFQPKFTPDGTKLLYRIRTGNASELWVSDLASNHTEPLLPGFPIPVSADFDAAWLSGYDISLDGRQLVFYSPDRDGKLRLWLAQLDRRSPPRQIPDLEGQQPLIGPGSEIFFRKVEGNAAFLYSVRLDGTGLRKAAETPLVNLFDVYPDHKWLLIGMSPDGEVIFPAAGGAPIFMHLHPPTWVRWTGDGKYLFVAGASDKRPITYVLPLSPEPGFACEYFTCQAFPSETAWPSWPGVQTIPVPSVVPGPTADLYAFIRETVQRNLYRIPVP